MRTHPGIISLDKLIGSAEPGRYTMPDEVVDAYDLYVRVRAVSVTEPEVLDLDTAAERVIASVAKAGDADAVKDAVKVAHTMAQTRADQEAARQARALVNHAAQRAGADALDTAASMADEIITAHLRPALLALYDEARAAVAALGGHDLADVHGMVTAASKVRTAYADLSALTTRRSILLNARSLVSRISGAGSQLDDRGLFSEMQHPIATFQPGWTPVQPVPPFYGPTDPMQRLVWLVTEGDQAGLWMPTGPEQDAAWSAQFGPDVDQRRSRARDAQAIVGSMS